MNQVIERLEDLMFPAFVKCQVEQDLTPLIVEGAPSMEELIEAWSNLVSLYHELAGTKAAQRHISIATRVASISAQQMIIPKLLEAAEALEETDSPAAKRILTVLLEDWGIGYKEIMRGNSGAFSGIWRVNV